jgi:hypothetical protein
LRKYKHKRDSLISFGNSSLKIYDYTRRMETHLLYWWLPILNTKTLFFFIEKLGHHGIFGVTAVIGAQFYWPKMRADIHHHIKSCHECQIRSVK